MRRRTFITLICAATAWPLAGRAQHAERVRRIGVPMGELLVHSLIGKWWRQTSPAFAA